MLKLINKNKILSVGGEKSDRGGKWGWRGREVGEREGKGGEGRERGERGGKWGLGTPCPPLITERLLMRRKE